MAYYQNMAAPYSGKGDLNHDGIVNSADKDVWYTVLQTGAPTTIYPGDPEECLRRMAVYRRDLIIPGIPPRYFYQYCYGHQWVLPSDIPRIYAVGDYMTARPSKASVWNKALWKVVAVDPLADLSGNHGTLTATVVCAGDNLPVGTTQTFAWYWVSEQYCKISALLYFRMLGVDIPFSIAGEDPEPIFKDSGLKFRIRVKSNDVNEYYAYRVLIEGKRKVEGMSTVWRSSKLIESFSTGDEQRVYPVVNPLPSDSDPAENYYKEPIQAYNVFFEQLKDIGTGTRRITKTQLPDLVLYSKSLSSRDLTLISVTGVPNATKTSITFTFKYIHSMGLSLLTPPHNGILLPYVMVMTEKSYDIYGNQTDWNEPWPMPLDMKNLRSISYQTEGVTLDSFDVTFSSSDPMWPSFIKYVPSGNLDWNVFSGAYINYAIEPDELGIMPLISKNSNIVSPIIGGDVVVNKPDSGLLDLLW